MFKAQKQMIYLVLFLMAILLLGACGGGSGGGDPATGVDDPAKSSQWDKMEWDKGQWK